MCAALLCLSLILFADVPMPPLHHAMLQHFSSGCDSQIGCMQGFDLLLERHTAASAKANNALSGCERILFGDSKAVSVQPFIGICMLQHSWLDLSFCRLSTSACLV